MWKSIITWPDKINTGESNPRQSSDRHPSAEHARSVCLTLRRRGFGMDGEIFPLGAKIEGPNGEKETVYEVEM